MWLSDRRVFLAGALAALGACGFQPVYGPGGAGGSLLSQITVAAPQTPEAYLFTRRFEGRAGRGGPSPRYRLTVGLSTDQTGSGAISSGSTTRIRVDGTARYALLDSATDVVLLEDSTEAFTGYSTTGSTVSTLASERDALERLMVILADRVIDALILAEPDLPE